MPQHAPTIAPTRTTSPEVEPSRPYRVDPERLCPEQKTRITRTISPHLP